MINKQVFTGAYKVLGGAVLGFILGLLLVRSCDSQLNPTVGTKIEQTVKIDTTLVRDSASGKLVSTPTKKTVVVLPGGVVRVTDTVHDTISVSGATTKQVNEYVHSAKLKNGKVTSKVLTDGNIYDITYDLETEEIVKTVTIKETVIQKQRGLFISPTMGFSPSKVINSAGAELEYLTRSGVILKLGADYRFDVPSGADPLILRAGVGLKVW